MSVGDIVLSEISQSQTQMLYDYDSIYMKYESSKITDEENVAVVSRSWGKRRSELLFSGYSIFVLHHEKNSGDGCWW
jgi:hypothetical protein